MHRPDRREALALGALGLGALALPRASRPNRPAELATAFRTASRAEAFGVAAEAIRGGASRDDVLGAVFLAGILDVRPRPHGILHCVMEVESNFQLAEAAAPDEAWLPVLWNLDDFKRSQARDADEDGDWRMPARPEVDFSSESEARRELIHALDAGDVERADRALVGLLPFHETPEGRETLLELLRSIGLACYAFIGHKAIYTAHVERVLRRLDWSHAEPALRSLVMTVLVDRNSGDHENALELAPELPADWATGEERPDASAELMGELAGRSPLQAQWLVVESLQDGLGPRTVWDAIHLLGAELFLRRPGVTATAGRNALLPVHGVTVPNALAYLHERTKSERTRRLALLQAAAWTARMRDDLGAMVGLSMEGPGLLALEAPTEAPADLDALLAEPTPEKAFALLEGHPESTTEYAARLRSSLFRRGIEHHQHKYAAATLEDAERVAPKWRPHLLAAGIEYLATPSEPDTDVYARSLSALRAAGLR